MPERHQQSREYYGFQATASCSEPPVLDRLSSAGSALTGGQFSVRRLGYPRVRTVSSAAGRGPAEGEWLAVPNRRDARSRGASSGEPPRL